MEEEKVQIGKVRLGDVMSWVGNIEDQLEVGRGMCGLDVNSSMQGYTILDAIKGSLDVSMSQLKDIRKELTEVYPEGGVS